MGCPNTRDTKTLLDRDTYTRVLPGAPGHDTFRYIIDAVTGRNRQLIDIAGGRYRDRTCDPYHVKEPIGSTESNVSDWKIILLLLSIMMELSRT